MSFTSAVLLVSDEDVRKNIKGRNRNDFFHSSVNWLNLEALSVSNSNKEVTRNRKVRPRFFQLWQNLFNSEVPSDK